ncbi:MAG: ribonuclease HII [Oligosphaeraceae bacterium]
MPGIARPFQLELSLGVECVAGVDEVGRGPLAGPVVVAAVALPLPPLPFDLPVNDSKKLTDARRRELDRLLREDSRVRFAIVERSPAQIDRMNILRATQDAMREAVQSLPGEPRPQAALVDGLGFAPFPVPATFVVKGDGRSASIAAASILAKVYRDTLMEEMDLRYPGYGFARNKGYGTAEHLEALNRLGPCPLHRRSFAPVAQPTLF